MEIVLCPMCFSAEVCDPSLVKTYFVYCLELMNKKHSMGYRFKYVQRHFQVIEYKYHHMIGFRWLVRMCPCILSDSLMHPGPQ